MKKESSRDVRLQSPPSKANPRGTEVIAETLTWIERPPGSKLHLRGSQGTMMMPCLACGDKGGAWIDSPDKHAAHPDRCL